MNELEHSFYYHYKKPHLHYKIIAVAFLESTLEKMVVYQAQYDIPELGEKPIFIRPFSEFTGTVEVNGQRIPRFSPVI